ncbi:MAG: class I SAM-dependent methyltransferase [Actinomycetota bacterium]
MADEEQRARTVYERTTDSYVDAIGTSISPDVETDTDIGSLQAFAALCLDRPVLDLGCGPGRAGRLVMEAGPTVVGLDLAATMIDVARMSNPSMAGVQATLTALPFRDRCLGGLVAWYSIIHVAPGRIAAAWDDFLRVLSPGAPLLLAFQAGADDAVHRQHAHGTDVTLTSYRHDPERVAAGLIEAGSEQLRLSVRAAEHEHESTPQAIISATAPGGRA